MALNWNRRAVLAALLYGICSASMAFVNKAVINSYGFNLPFFILTCQMILTIAFLELGRHSALLDLPAYSLKLGRTFMVPSFFYALHCALSLIALSGMNIPMYGALKRCTPLVSLVLAVVLLHKPYPSPLLLCSILIITGGCLVAGLGDLSFDWYAYSMGSLSVLAQGLYLTLVEKMANKKHSTTEILQMNAFNTLPFFLCCSLASGEIVRVVQSPGWTDPEFILMLLLQVSLGAVLNYSLFLCTTLTSALTTSLVGVAKSVFQTVVGFFTFGGVAFNPLNIIGIFLNTIGGILYTYAKFKEKDKEKCRSSDENENNHIVGVRVEAEKDEELLLDSGFFTRNGFVRSH